MTSRYRAVIVEDAHGVRLTPAADLTIPQEPNEVHMLALAIALAMGAAHYEHHPQPRDPEVQTMDDLLAGQTTMPWRRREPHDEGHPTRYIECERSEAGSWRCHVHP